MNEFTPPLDDLTSQKGALKSDQKSGTTPVMAQYLEIKASVPDSLLFFRMGDFYELFFEDAEICARELSLTLTKRGRHEDKDIPLAGVPVHTVDAYISKLIKLNYRVAICEQLEDPQETKKRGSKAVVKRGLVRIITPGTLTDDGLLDKRASSRLAALSLKAGIYGLCVFDLSTGEIEVMSGSATDIMAEISALLPKETLVQDRILADEALSLGLKHYGGAIEPQSQSQSDVQSAIRRLCDLYGVQTLDGFGSFNEAETASLGMVTAYICLTQPGLNPLIKPPKLREIDDGLKIDAATRQSLEILRTQKGEYEGSLLSVIDYCHTPSGSRLLHERLMRPLSDAIKINERLDAVSFLLDHPDFVDTLTPILKKWGDPVRALSRLNLGRATLRDLASLRQALVHTKDMNGFVQALREKHSDPQGLSILPKAISEILSIGDIYTELEALCGHFSALLVDELPAQLKDGGFVREGFSPELDHYRALCHDSRRIILSLELDMQARTQTPLKIRYNALIGYFYEATAKQAESLSPNLDDFGLIRRQNMSNGMRYTSDRLISLERDIASAESQSKAIELGLYEELLRQISLNNSTLLALFDAVAHLDVMMSSAHYALIHRCVRPHIDHTFDFDVKDGCHPVVLHVKRKAGDPYSPNDLMLDGQGQTGPRLCLITGPNMAGKSTFLRQNALLIVLAQTGLYVPCTYMRLGVVDRLYSRVGSGDDLAHGRSTFLTEMVETAAILHHATNKSFVILDEIGRGTSTYDGLSIAWACAEYLHDHKCARALFATHYHELSELERSLSSCQNLSLQAKEHRGQLIFLHQVVKGAADRSYGVYVAKLAGIPKPVIARANSILQKLEADNPGQLKRDVLPLFAHFDTQEALMPDYSQIQEENPQESAVISALFELNPDSLTPREALDAIYRLKSLLT